MKPLVAATVILPEDKRLDRQRLAAETSLYSR
jgi:hypothetical protein